MKGGLMMGGEGDDVFDDDGSFDPAFERVLGACVRGCEEVGREEGG